MNSLRQIRERKGLTLAQLSGKTSISLRTLSEYETGSKTVPLAHMRSLAKALWVAPDELTRPAQAETGERMIPGVARPEVARAVPANPPAGAPTLTEAEPLTPSEASAQPVSSESEPSAIERGTGVGEPTPASGPAAAGAPGAAAPGRSGGARQARPPLPVTAGQLGDITRLADALKISGDDLASRLGLPLAEATRPQARQLISQLRAEAAAAGVREGRPKSVREQPDREEEYLKDLSDRRALLLVKLFTGEEFRGRIAGFSPYVIAIREESTGSEVVLRKLAITYYSVAEADAPPAGEHGESRESE